MGDLLLGDPACLATSRELFSFPAKSHSCAITHLGPSPRRLHYVPELVSDHLVRSPSNSGGVMIYFDRIEVVNFLVPNAGMSL